MSGVSAPTGGNIVDLDAIVQGGDAFLERIKTLKAETDANNQALENLNLGKDVAAAMRDAQAREQTALDLIADAKTEAAKIIADATKQAADIVSQAQGEADALSAKAKSESEELSLQVKNAQDVLTAWSEKTKAEANQIMAEAKAAKAEADRMLADNSEAASKLTDDLTKTKAAQDAATAMQVELKSKIDSIDNFSAWLKAPAS